MNQTNISYFRIITRKFALSILRSLSLEKLNGQPLEMGAQIFQKICEQGLTLTFSDRSRFGS